MEDVTDVTLEPLTKSNFLVPKHVRFTQNGTRRSCDCITEHSDVSVLLYNSSRNIFLFVKQFRPAIYLSNAKTEVVNSKEEIDTRKFSGHLGVTIELCAGIVDKEGPLIEIAQAEVLEECGYNVPLENLQKVTSFRNGSNICGALVTLFYGEVTDAMRVSQGGGLVEEGELIEVVELSIKETQELMYDESLNREMSLLLALQWFFHQVWPDKVKQNLEKEETRRC